ncbi:MAG: EpsG family protein [Myxococcales bacterium]|jgi:hypothetical protein|nr:EpsG family protein [Myxococcales bacterium]
MYWLLFSVILIFFIIDYIRKTNSSAFYYLSLFSLTALLCFRFGQGTDYPNYQELYQFPSHGEWGYRFLTMFLRDLGVSFPTFIFFISLVQCALIHKAISRYSCNRNFSLFLLYPTIYLTYFFSGIRQGLVIAVFLGIMLPLLEKRSFIKYIFFCLFMSLFHTVALILLPLIFIHRLKVNLLLILMFISLILGIINQILPFGIVIGNFFAEPLDLEREFRATQSYTLAFLERVLMCFIVTFIVVSKDSEFRKNDSDILLFKVYLFGFFVFMLFSANNLIASRFGILFKSVEIFLLPLITLKTIKLRHAFAVTICVFCFILTWKNITSYISQGDYFKNVTVLNYPYISVFNKEEILEYRDYDYKYIE